MHFESVTPSKVSPAVSQMILLPIVYFFYFSTREVYFGKWINYLKSRPPVFVNIGTDCKKVTDEIYKKTNLKKLYTHNILTKWVRFFLDSRHTGKRRTQCTDIICPVHYQQSCLSKKISSDDNVRARQSTLNWINVFHWTWKPYFVDMYYKQSMIIWNGQLLGNFGTTLSVRIPNFRMTKFRPSLVWNSLVQKCFCSNWRNFEQSFCWPSNKIRNDKILNIRQNFEKKYLACM
jgi:hypothetical protein